MSFFRNYGTDSEKQNINDVIKVSLLVPDRQQVFLDELQDRVEPHPETERLSWDILLEEDVEKVQ